MFLRSTISMRNGMRASIWAFDALCIRQSPALLRDSFFSVRICALSLLYVFYFIFSIYDNVFAMRYLRFCCSERNASVDDYVGMGFLYIEAEYNDLYHGQKIGDNKVLQFTCFYSALFCVYCCVTWTSCASCWYQFGNFELCLRERVK